MKQLYRPDYILSHCVHYSSTVIAGLEISKLDHDIDTSTKVIERFANEIDD